MKIVDIYVGQGDNGPFSLVLQLDNGERVTVAHNQLDKLSQEIRKLENLLTAQALQGKLTNEPKIPCGFAGCTRLRPQSLVACEQCINGEKPENFKETDCAECGVPLDQHTPGITCCCGCTQPGEGRPGCTVKILKGRPSTFPSQDIYRLMIARSNTLKLGKG